MRPQSVADIDYLSRAVEFFGFQYAFAANALGASVLVGLLCGVVGVFLVLRGLSLIGDATGHATLPGVCLGFLVAGEKAMGALLGGALASGFLAALLVGAIARGRRTRSDAAIGVVLSVFFGLGIVLLSYIQNSPTGAQSGLKTFLYGNAAGVTGAQLAWLGGLTALVLAGVALFFRPLTLSIFDRDFARATGVPVRRLHYGLLAALSIAVVVSIQSVGVVLVSAMLIIPPSAALLVSRRLPTVVGLSAAIGIASGALGAFASYLFEGVSTGPAMTIAAAGFFGLALLFGPRGGLLFRALRRSRGRARATREVSHAL